MSNKNLVRLPNVFLSDHIDRDLPAPKAERETARFTWVKADDPTLPELLEDALFYAGGNIDADTPELRSLVRSAAATVRAIKAA